MKIYCYSVWDYMGNDKVAEITESEILERYWKFWYDKMAKKYDEGHHLITEENCIKDWCVDNWAWEKE